MEAKKRVMPIASYALLNLLCASCRVGLLLLSIPSKATTTSTHTPHSHTFATPPSQRHTIQLRYATATPAPPSTPQPFFINLPPPSRPPSCPLSTTTTTTIVIVVVVVVPAHAHPSNQAPARRGPCAPAPPRGHCRRATQTSAFHSLGTPCCLDYPGGGGLRGREGVRGGGKEEALCIYSGGDGGG